MSDVAQKGRGRPSIFTQELADEICRRLAGGESLRAICESEDMPDESTVRGWALDNKDGFFPQYERARLIAYHGMGEGTLDISDNPSTDSGAVMRDRLRVDTRKWFLSKVLPKVYGDKIETTQKLVDENDQPVSGLELARRIAFAFAQAGAMTEAPASPPTKH